jgi:Fe-Mn family superoxide dismutase
MSIALRKLPYAPDALEPAMSRQTVEYHYGKHHAGYVDKLNTLIEGTELADRPLEEIVRESADLLDAAVFNNAAQVYNHEMFWQSMSPGVSQVSEGEFARAIRRDFGSFDKLREEFRFSALTLFGSGWVWLVSDSGRLRIVTTGNAGTPLLEGLDPLIALDVWEHAYYLDVKNDRAAYVDGFLNDLVDWEAANDRYIEFRHAA